MSARERALQYLGRFARTELQVRRYLQRKQFSSEEIADAIEFLHAHHFLNDTSYAEAYISSRIQRGDGPLKIKQLLFQKGISSAEAGKLLEANYPVEVQIENARKLLKKRNRSRDQNIRFVASRGYPHYVIRKVISHE